MNESQVSSAAPGVNPGQVVDQEAGEVPTGLDDRQFIELDQAGGLPALRLYVRPVKRRKSKQILQWLTFLRDKVNQQNAQQYEQQVMRCWDEFDRILREHLVGWESAYNDQGKAIAFDLDALDDVIDDGQLMIAVSGLYEVSQVSSMSKKPSGSPLRLSTQAAAGSIRGSETVQPSEPMSTRNALDASAAKGDTPVGSVGLSEAAGTMRPSSIESTIANPPPPPLRPASG